jgi:RHS repeat-associated protein
LKVSTTATWTYGWDNLNRMVGVKQVTATGTQLSVSYSYDVLGKRVEDDTWKSSTGTTLTVRHAYDGNNIWADVTTTNTLLARYVYGDQVDQVWARAVPAGLTNSGVAWYLTDREGSVRDIMDSSSVIQDHIDYDGYGNATHTTISFADSHGYAGGQTDLNTGLVQQRGRWYGPAMGRWMSEDPSGFGGGINLYGYVGNDPTNLVDPSGLAPIKCKLAMDDFGPAERTMIRRAMQASYDRLVIALKVLDAFHTPQKEKIEWVDDGHGGLKIRARYTALTEVSKSRLKGARVITIYEGAIRVLINQFEEPKYEFCFTPDHSKYSAAEERYAWISHLPWTDPDDTCIHLTDAWFYQSPQFTRDKIIHELGRQKGWEDENTKDHDMTTDVYEWNQTIDWLVDEIAPVLGIK